MSKNLKEYLKKYSNEPKKKKKRSHPATNKHLKIIDDDEFCFNDMKHDDEMIFTKEDAPQIVGVIDERPPELIANDFKNSDKWKGIISNGDSSNQKRSDKQDLSPLRLQNKSPKSTSPDLSPKRFSSNVLDDLSPDRSTTSKIKYSPDLSPRRYRSSSSKCYSPDIKSRNRNQCTEKSKHSNINNSSMDRANKDSSSQRFNSSIISQTKEQYIHPDEYQNQEVVKRDRRTGKRITLESTLQDKKEKDKKQEAKNEKYTRWGLGIKQIEAYEQKVQEDTHEMSKPFARFSDDIDLDNHLKNQYRDGDPMLDYIRQKDSENKLISGKPSVPIYKGLFPINRFNIRPGYRWDGVNRSNGYEDKWFEVINKRKATEEQAYRYSTEDM